MGRGSREQPPEWGSLAPRCYLHDEAVLVPLPEVRVELDPGQRAAVVEAIRTSPLPVEIVDDAEERFVLRPESGSGDDAIAIANHVFEHAHPASSAVNFVRFVPRPLRKGR